MNIAKIFSELGLKEDHLKIYEASLAWGQTTISNLSYKSKVPRTTVYELIDDLINIGLIKLTIKNDSKLYSPSDPNLLLLLLSRRKSEIDELLAITKEKVKELKAIQNTNKMKPRVYLLEGAEGIKQAYEMTFEAKEVLIQCLTDDYGDVPGDFFDDYFERFFKKTNIKSKEILAENEDDDYIDKYGSAKNLQLRIPVSGDTSTDFMIFEDKVVFVSFTKGASYALVIEDPKVVNCMKTLFNLAWESAGRKDKRVQEGKKVLTEYK